MSEAITLKMQHITFVCSNVQASQKWFVEGVGAKLVNSMEARGAKFIFLELGGVRFVLQGAIKGQEFLTAGPPRYGMDHITLAVDNVRVAVTELKARGVIFISEPKGSVPGYWTAYFQGPDNVRFEMVGPSKD